jgi:AcrR family transcriptional regulator
VPPRLTADERRVQLVDAAIEEFAQAGLTGASTEAIARRAGISHAYVFRLFPTKRELFLAAIDRCFDNTQETFAAAYAARDPDTPVFQALGDSYVQLIRDRARLLFQLHAYAACGDEDIRDRVRERYLALMDYVQEVSGASDDMVRLFMSTGLLIAVGAAIDAPDLAPDGSHLRRAFKPEATAHQ